MIEPTLSDDFGLVRAWLDDDEDLRIPDTDWGRGLYTELLDLLAENKRLRRTLERIVSDVDEDLRSDYVRFARAALGFSQEADHA